MVVCDGVGAGVGVLGGGVGLVVGLLEDGAGLGFAGAVDDDLPGRGVVLAAVFPLLAAFLVALGDPVALADGLVLGTDVGVVPVLAAVVVAGW